MREPSSHLGAGLEKQSIWSGGDRALAVGSRSARSSFRHRARGHPGGANNDSAQNGGSIHDWVARRVETARISLKRTPRFRLAPRGGQNGTRPGYRAILHGECALGALEGRFWFPGRSGHIGGRPPTQGVHPSAVEALGARNADLPAGWSLPTTPPQNPMARGRPVRAPTALNESGWA